MKDHDDKLPVDPRDLKKYLRSDKERSRKRRTFSRKADAETRNLFNGFPEHFQDQLEDLYLERGPEEGPLFNLGRDVRSPLVWLMLNAPDRFLLACEQCAVFYKGKHKELTSGKKERMSKSEAKELSTIRSELESELRGLDLRYFQESLQKEASKRYFEMTSLIEEEERDDFEFERIDTYLKDHGWIFNKKTVKQIRQRIKELYQRVMEMEKLVAGSE